MDDIEVGQLADVLRSARRRRQTLSPLTADGPLSLTDAYRIQSRLTAARLADGERRIGWKLGYTSRAMREQMGVEAPNFGPLTDVMLLEDGARVPSSAVQPRVEPEIAVILGDRAPALGDVRLGDVGFGDVGFGDVGLGEGGLGEGGLGDGGLGDGEGLAEVASAIASVHAALEVVDSIWTGYRFRLEDNTADGSSAAWFVLGPPLPADRLPDIRVELRSSAGVLTGSGADADGHPLRGVAWLARQLAARGERLAAGDVVITGGLTRAVALDAEVRARFRAPGAAAVEVSVLPPG